uniref:Uncharacterized protein n=1 Tax=Knipowitschia caucasica TaxID=637954 RepID=A0AAV2J5Z5_KNICA
MNPEREEHKYCGCGSEECVVWWGGGIRDTQTGDGCRDAGQGTQPSCWSRLIGQMEALTLSLVAQINVAHPLAGGRCPSSLLRTIPGKDQPCPAALLLNTSSSTASLLRTGLNT